MADEIKLDDIAPYLGRAVPDLGALVSLHKFDTGQSNPTYRLVTEAGDFVLRAKPPGKLLASAHQVEREYRVMAALAQSDVPVPHMVHLAGDDVSPLGRAFFVMALVPGRIFWDPALPELDLSARAQVYDGMNKTLAALHNVAVRGVGLEDFGKAGDYFARQTSRWSQQYRATAPVPSDDMVYLADWLSDHMPADDGQVTLVHGDFRLDNMIFNDKAHVAALLDWELSTLGHPLADLAYQCMQWRLPHDAGMRGLGGLRRSDLGVPDEDSYVARYCDRRGITLPENWPFYLAFSFFRLAAILQGVVRRAAQGNASNPQAGRRYESAIPVLASMAVAVTGRAA